MKDFIILPKQFKIEQKLFMILWFLISTWTKIVQKFRHDFKCTYKKMGKTVKLQFMGQARKRHFASHLHKKSETLKAKVTIGKFSALPFIRKPNSNSILIRFSLFTTIKTNLIARRFALEWNLNDLICFIFPHAVTKNTRRCKFRYFHGRLGERNCWGN